ncbi:hypothetical protein [Bacillus cereus group sp. MYBK215-1]|uniref:hypothetical protein n=1 Tax=unclassified Bacillus cereus group TaxID=2750818 RepID=UPI003F79E92A
MKVTVKENTKKKSYKKGDVFQGVSGTYYQIIQDSANQYRALDIAGCEIRMDSCDTPDKLVNNFLTEEGVHYLREDIEMIIK